MHASMHPLPQHHLRTHSCLLRCVAACGNACTQVLTQPGILHSALSSLVRLMLSRYTCGLEHDRALLARLQQLPPRQAAALLARVPEKEVLQQLMQVRDKVNRYAR